MESSRIAIRGVRQVARCSDTCRHSFHLRRSHSFTTHAPKSPRFTHRSFSTTSTINESQGAGNNGSESNFKLSEATAPDSTRASRVKPQQGQPQRQRIDLSTIPGMPSSYRPPARPDEATAQAKLRSLLGAVGTPATKSSSSSSSSSQSRSDTSNDPNDPINYNPSSLDAYTGSRTGRRPATPALDLASLIEEFDRPRRGNDSFSTDSNEPVEVLRLRPTLGRTVKVTPATGFDLTRAFRQLEAKCNTNNVKKDEIKQRFHVRRGQRAKIERRTRWRALFKEGFIAECARIRRMRTQGW